MDRIVCQRVRRDMNTATINTHTRAQRDDARRIVESTASIAAKEYVRRMRNGRVVTMRPGRNARRTTLIRLFIPTSCSVLRVCPEWRNKRVLRVIRTDF